MRVITSNYFKVWEIDEKEKYSLVRMSTSRKVDDKNTDDKSRIDNGIAKNGYVSESFQYVRFVGKAFNKLKKDIVVGTNDTITNLEMNFDFEPYYNNETKEVKYPRYPRITVFSFNLPSEVKKDDNARKGMDKAPAVADEDVSVEQQPMAEEPELDDDDELPF